MDITGLEQITFLGVRITNCAKAELNSYICQTIEAARKEPILNVNINCMNLAWELPWLRKLLNETPVVFCDGEGVRLGARLLGLHIREKITYNRWIWDLAQLSESMGFTWYLVGAKQNVIEEAVRKLKQAHPNLQVCGFRSGYFADDKEIEQTVAAINSKKPNILVLGMGMPFQEKWLMDNLYRLETNVLLTGGAVFDYLSGRARMTPALFYRLKLEWFYRLMLEPRRLFRRYVIGNPLFFARVILHKALNYLPSRMSKAGDRLFTVLHKHLDS